MVGTGNTVDSDVRATRNQHSSMEANAARRPEVFPEAEQLRAIAAAKKSSRLTRNM
jgi:hypothetical protein